MSNYKPTIGIEIHLELNTKTKMFSSAPNIFGAEANTCVAPTDIAYPGTLPVINKEAVISGIKLAKALKMKIDNELHFDRKNYFYPDLPKGFQITQQRRPIGSDGTLELKDSTVTLERIHLEEDTAKSSHSGESTTLDYNRAGVPLIEIVTNPVITGAKQAREYVEMIRDIARTLDISDARMEQGSMRVDVNISISDSKKLGTKVEIKNMNSTANIEKAISNEIELQTKALENGEVVEQMTKRFDEETQSNKVMRSKSDSVDYKYFAEPNIPILKLEQDFIDSITIPMLPLQRRKEYLSNGISEEFVDKLMSDLTQANYFDLIKVKDKVKLSKIFFAEVVSLANSKGITIQELNIIPNELSKAINYSIEGKISSKQLKELITKLVDSKETDIIIEKLGMKQISSEEELIPIINKVIEKLKDQIEKNKDRPERVSKIILGNVMKETGGKANPQVTSKLVFKMIK